LSFIANLEEISSSYGRFSGFEVFTIYGGSGDDVIRTRDGNDTLWGGAGTNILEGGGGNDHFYSVSLSDWSDGGVGGYDFWQANWSTASGALIIDIGSDVKLFGSTVAINMESVSVSAGTGNDVINITRTGSVYVYGGGGYDILTSNISVDQVQNFLVNTTTSGTLFGNANEAGFQDVERVFFTGGGLNDTFRVLGIFTADQINFDGGAGSDSLVAQFELLTGSTSFIVNTDGTITSNRGQFAGFETFTISSGDANDTLTGGEGDDNLNGGAGNDTLNGRGGNDFLSVSKVGIKSVNGGTGVDTLFVDYQGATTAIFTTGPGNTFRPSAGESGFSGSFTDSLGSPERAVRFENIDRFSIITGSGADTIITGTGNDQVFSGSGDDNVDVGSGDDTADGGIGFDTISADLSQAATGIFFDIRANAYSGGIGSFTNFERFGTLKTGSGNDTIITSGDRPVGGGAVSGSDETIDVGAGNDRVTHYSGADVVIGGSGFDTLVVDYRGKTGFVSWEVHPTEGMGTFASGYNGVFRNDSSGSRVTYTGIEAFVITVGNGASATIRTGSGDDIITTGDGGDLITPGGGSDMVNAGAGLDRVDYAQRLIGAETGNVGVVINFSGTSFVVPAGHPNAGMMLASGQAIDNFGAVDTLLNVEGADTGAQNDILIGGSAQNFFNAGGGDDTLTGGDGADVLNGGDGIDTLDYSREGGTFGAVVNLSGFFLNPTGRNIIGSIGPNEALDTYNARDTLAGIENVVTGDRDDWIVGSEARNVITANGGNDRINGHGGNDELHGGAGDDNITGDAGDDLLTGGEGNDTLNGGVGVDTMIGGTGNDLYFVDNVGDTVTELAGEGNADEVRTFLANYTLPANVENLTLTGTAPIAGHGNALDNELRGNSANNILSGDAGADRLFGGAGDDMLDGGAGDDLLDGGAGEDVAVFESALRSGGLVVDGSGAIVVTGPEGRDVLTGIEILRFSDGDVRAEQIVAIDRQYVAYAGRHAEAAELSYWAGEARDRGATLGEIRSAILDHPIGEAHMSATITALYQAYAGRGPDAGELSYWKGAVRGGSEFINVRAAILDHPIGQTHMTTTITALYQAYAGRAPEAAELNNWKSAIQSGAELSSVRGAILGHEIGQTHMTKTITALYQAYAGRGPEAAELSYWKGAIQSGSEFGNVRAAILDHAIGQTHMTTTITALYQAYAGRAPEAAELSYWKGAIQSGNEFVNVRNAILNHPIGDAHMSATITELYETYAGRAPEAAELNYWKGALRGGAEFTNVRTAILDHPIGQTHTEAMLSTLYQEYFGRGPNDDAQLLHLLRRRAGRPCGRRRELIEQGRRRLLGGGGDEDAVVRRMLAQPREPSPTRMWTSS
jgi:Ca2+-binding RTX toxin-like protein